MPKQLDYNEKYNEVLKRLEQEKSIVLATSADDKVTARAVWFVLHDAKIYFFTSLKFTKYKQIEKNNNVALCVDNIQIEGIAKSLGHPCSEENKCIFDCLLKNNPDSKQYIKYKNNVLVEVKIKKIEMWVNRGPEYIDCIKEKAYR